MNKIQDKRAGYPRPAFYRAGWQSLDGTWDFAFDREDAGETQGWRNGFKKQYDIRLPYAYECEASGIGVEESVKSVWYSRSFKCTPEKNKRLLLHFDGVDFLAKVWINGQFAVSHKGGYTRFTADITSLVKEGENLIVVKAEDDFSLEHPRGKQRWLDRNYGCWYTQFTGIWKSVWLETVPETYLERIKTEPLFEDYAVKVTFDVANLKKGCSVTLSVGFKGETYQRIKLFPAFASESFTFDLQSTSPENQVHIWHPENPLLYDLTVEVEKDGQKDVVESYFGFRKFSVENGVTALNNVPYYEKFILYQGYWEKTGLTAPDEESILKDFALIKEMGYNGIRMHQYIGEEKFFYLADKAGLLIWCEMPSPHRFNDAMKLHFASEWQDIIKQYYNFVSLSAWVVFNESWGIRGVYANAEQQKFVHAMYLLTKSYDQMRPVISNDGWEHVASDILTVHNYEQDAEKLYEMYEDFPRALSHENAKLPQPPLLAKGYEYTGQPVVLSEYGGCAFKTDTADGWGYGKSVDGIEDFYGRFGGLLKAIARLKKFSGYCYTQFTDVMQEKNGLFTIDRKPKVDVKRIRELNDLV